MNIKSFSDRILAKQNSPFDSIPDAVPYKYFDAIYYLILEELEEQGVTQTVFWHENKDMLRGISKAVMAQLLIILGERKAKKEVEEIGQENEWQEMPDQIRENLIWNEIKKLLYG